MFAPPGALVLTMTVLLAPLASVPNWQFKTFDTIVQPPGLLLRIQLFKLPSVGSGSFNTTLFTEPGPVLVTTIVKLMLSPRLYVAFFGLLTRVYPPGGVQIQSPVSVNVGWPVPVNVAVLFNFCPPGQAEIFAPPDALVATTTVLVAPLARVPNWQFKTFDTIVQPPGLLLMIQLFRLPRVGSGSFSTTLFTEPGPVLVTTIVKLMLSPML